jgi:hypothetical protein
MGCERERKIFEICERKSERILGDERERTNVRERVQVYAIKNILLSYLFNLNSLQRLFMLFFKNTYHQIKWKKPLKNAIKWLDLLSTLTFLKLCNSHGGLAYH